MDTVTEIYEMMVRSYTNASELMIFATTMGIQESPVVKFRLFQLRQPDYTDEMIEGQLDDLLETLGGPMETPVTLNEIDLELAFDYVKDQEKREGTVKVLSFDGDMEETARLCLQDGVWDPSSPVTQTGSGEEPQPGPSHGHRGIQYTIKKKSERTCIKNAAVERTYRVKINERHEGERLQDIYQGLHQMFDDVLEHARGDLAGNDVGRVVIHHDGLHDPIVVPLQPWDKLNADTVMETIEKVLNSSKGLSIDNSFDISIGSINLPKGGSRHRITKVRGKNNSLLLKKSIVTIENKDKLCMARAIAVSWAKLKRCTSEEWKTVIKERDGKSNLELVLKHQQVPLTYYSDLLNKKRTTQQQLAIAISQLAGVPLDRPASLSDLETFETVLGVRVMVVSARLGNKFLTSGSKDERPCIYLYLVDDSHFHAITSITGFFSCHYFCQKCLKHYDHKERHKCELKCIVCKTDKCLKTESPVKCNDCNMECRSEVCYKRHREVPSGLNRQRDDDQCKPTSQCETYWKCPACYKVINKTKRQIKKHRCGEYLCTSCDTYVLEDHLCYLRAAPYKDTQSKFIFFDFECSQDQLLECNEGYKSTTCGKCQPENPCTSCTKCQNCKASWCGKATHRPNYVVAQSACTECKETSTDIPCRKCGDRCQNCTSEVEEKGVDKQQCLSHCGRREVIFEGDDTLNEFGEWLFSSQHSNFKAVAHNMKGYDGYFLLEYLIDQSLRPGKIVYSGSKIMYMTVERGLNITVMDSLNFLPMKLAALPETFGLTELKKGWFPHYFNTRDNQRYRGPYPEPSYYGVEFMGVKERDKFLKWHAGMKDELFDFRSEIEAYCRSDVDILRRACLIFRDLLKDATRTMALVDVKKKKKTVKEVRPVSVDPFNYSTIASVCMGIYKTKFLEEKWEVQLNGNTEWIPARYMDGNLNVFKDNAWVKEGYLKDDKITNRKFIKSPIAKVPVIRKDQFSKESIQWLEWKAKTDGVFIQHALNTGEKTLPGTRYKLDGFCQETNTAYEFHGCVFHGCATCFPDQDTVHPMTKQSMKELYAVTQKKRAYIEGLGMNYVCVWEHEFQQLLRNEPNVKLFVDNLDTFDRLDPRDSFFGGRTNACQLYYRVTDGEQIKYVDFTSLYPWVNKYCEYPVGHPDIITKEFKNIQDYFGIAKVRILPPKQLYHPVLPYRSNGKLKFSLCRTCADVESQDPCTCTDDKRALTGTWCTTELKTAVRLGYTIMRIYEVYHWEDTTKYNPETREGGLFAKYIDTFLKFKQEASGPPDWVETKEDGEVYIDQYFKREGVQLTEENITKNSGLRALAKLCLNSFWGKFGQRLNMKQTNFFHEQESNAFFQTFTDPMKVPHNFHIVSDDLLQMEWTYKTACQPEDNKTNIYLATFTTCWARLKLYSVLERLGRRVLYYDTDSTIYVSRPGQYDPPQGDYLGELTDELEADEYITEFVSGGPKNYAYRTNTDSETCKVRGFTLNYTNSRLINFESVKTLVTSPNSNNNITVTNPSKISRDKRKRALYNREEQKSYQMVYTKRRRIDQYDTVPYGY